MLFRSNRAARSAHCAAAATAGRRHSARGLAQTPTSTRRPARPLPRPCQPSSYGLRNKDLTCCGDSGRSFDRLYPASETPRSQALAASSPPLVKTGCSPFPCPPRLEINHPFPRAALGGKGCVNDSLTKLSSWLTPSACADRELLWAAQSIAPNGLFFHQPSAPIFNSPAQAGYGDKWPS